MNNSSNPSQANLIPRREFFYKSAIITASPLFNTLFKPSFPDVLNSKQLARIYSDNTPIYRLPESNSAIIKMVKLNDVIELESEKDMPCGLHISNQWVAVYTGGFLRTIDFQPVENNINEPRINLVKGSALVEITVPFTQAWKAKNSGVKGSVLFYYGSNHWVTGLAQDQEKKYYYKIVDDRWDTIYYVDAEHARVIPEDELIPIHPDASDKHIEVSIKDQQVYAYEGEKMVFTSSAATGIVNDKTDYSTPTGVFRINYKRPSRHMIHTDRIGPNDDDLFGVPWVTYFTDTGVAFHGTYWHNSYGAPRSHGCVNMPIPAARWIYLWTLPQVPPKERTFVSRNGTSVRVI